jgi:L-amino acid N-acyltransferase YncA
MTSTTEVRIRAAGPADAQAICSIYNHYVATTTISFEEDAVTAHEMANRIADVQGIGLPWLVLTAGQQVMGYAYATKWRARPAYRSSVESTVYLDREATGHGWGKALYMALLQALREAQAHTVIGGIAQPNERSVALHEGLGFVKVAHFEQVGRKFGRWVDVAYWQLHLEG